jgi:aspartate/methionine/tyrosine aminotransferase
VARPLWLTRFLVRTRLARLLPVAHRLTDGGAAFLRHYSDAVLAAPIEELQDPAYFPAAAGPEVLDLNMPAPHPGSAAGAVPTAGRRGTPPPWGLPELRGAITDLYVRRDGRAVDPDQGVFVTHGATGAFTAALDAFVNPGDRVVLFDPTSPLFALGARSRRASVRWVPTSNEGGRLRFSMAEFERAVRGAKLVVLCDPGNPTGACLTPEDLEQTVRVIARRGSLLYVDESFTRYHYDGHGRSAAVLPGAEKCVLTAGSVSQGYGLAAARVGWVAGHRHLVRACAVAAIRSAPFVPAVCQEAASRALAAPDAEFAPTLEHYRGRRQYILDRLRAAGLEPESPAGGYFVWVSVAPLGLDGRAFANRLLKEAKVRVGPGYVFGPSAAGHVRVSFAADDGRLREGLTRLTAFVARLQSPAASEPVPADEPPAPAAEGERPRPVFSRV